MRRTKPLSARSSPTWRRRPDKRGKLRFDDVRIEMLAPDAAQLISRYEPARPEAPQYGINTRLMRKVDGRWVISLDHVSAVETPP